MKLQVPRSVADQNCDFIPKAELNGSIRTRNRANPGIYLKERSTVMLRKAISSVCCSAFALAFCIVVPCYAQSSGSANTSGKANAAQKSNVKPVKGSQNGTQPNGTQPKMEVSRMAVHFLRLTDQARQAIINKDQHSAQNDVDRAVSLLKQVETKLPNTKNDNTHVVPIFAELEQTSFLQPVLTA